MATPKKRIAIVGGGLSGLASIISLKEEGLDPVCFEKTDKPGGTWCYREKSTIGVPSLMPTTILNHSKELGSLSNYPVPKEYSNYLRHDDIYEIITNYCTQRGIFEHIKFNSEVIEVKESADYEETGRWIVTVRDTLTETVTSNIYDSVIIGVGHFNIPNIPTYKGQDKFRGKIIHTHSLKRVTPFEDEKVIVVGMGCSGLDAAVEISNVAKKVYLSTRSGAYVCSRVGPWGYPIDYVMFRRYFTILLDILPTNMLSWIVENFLLDPKFNSRLYTVQPRWHMFSKDPVFNDQIGSKLLSGSVVQKPDIKEFVENGVIFEGESEVTEANVIIMATGYTMEFPFLDERIFKNENNEIQLYKCIWPPFLKHPTLAFVGFVLPFGPGFPIGEMQARYVAHIMAGKGKLPDVEKMLEDILRRSKTNAARYSPSEKQAIRVDFVQYLDELAELIGVKPNFLKMFFTDPKLWFKLIFGPSVSYQYRLQGPHAWSGAREAIMTCEERIHWPLIKKEVKKTESLLIVFIKKFIMWLLPFT